MALAGDLFPPMDHPELGFPAASGGRARGTAGRRHRSRGPVSSRRWTVTSAWHREGTGTHCGSRIADEAMIAAGASTSDRVAVVVQCGSAVMMPWADTVRSLLVSWYPGVEGGNALADVLTGVAEPGGRLPFAIPTDADHLVPFDKDATTVVYDLLHGQWETRRGRHAAQFPFGAGRMPTSSSSSAGPRSSARPVGVRRGHQHRRTGPDRRWCSRSVGARLRSRSTDSTADRVRPGAPRTGGVGTRRRSHLDWTQLDVRRDGTWWTEPGPRRHGGARCIGPGDHDLSCPVVR